MRLLLTVIILALTIYALLDCSRTPEANLPARMPKFLWLLLIIVFNGIGAIAWIITSRVKAAEARAGLVEKTLWSSETGTDLHLSNKTPSLPPDDNPEFLRNLDKIINHKETPEDPKDPEATEDK